MEDSELELQGEGLWRGTQGPGNGHLQGAPKVGEGFRRGKRFGLQPAEPRKASLTSSRRPEGQGPG